MEYIDWFSWYTVVIMSLIVLLVVGLLGWCVWKFNERANPTPSRVTHHTTIEVLWTVLPVLVLVAIAIPSFRLLYGQYDPSKLYADFDPQTAQFLNVKVTGLQWSWDVAYSNDEQSAPTALPSRSRCRCSWCPTPISARTSSATSPSTIRWWCR
jgi:cytochrome c oxidase subunit 2